MIKLNHLFEIHNTPRLKLPTRGDGTIRVGAEVPLIPPTGPTMIPAENYTSEARFEQERIKVMRRSWFMVAPSSSLVNVGDYVVFEGFGESVVVVRQGDRSVRAFHNVCQHRGARIVDPEHVDEAGVGHCKRGQFECPWHGFCYGLDGTVVDIPDREDFAPGQVDGLRAVEAVAEEWGGWIWLCMDPDEAEALDEYLGPDIIEELGHFNMQDMIVHSKRDWVIQANWKAVVDGFIEVFHVGKTHEPTIGDRLALRETYQELFDRHSMYVIPNAGNLKRLLETKDHIRHAISHYLVFPNSIFNCQATHIQAFQPIPLGANETLYRCWNLILKGGGEDYAKSMDRYWKHFCRVADEDIYVGTQAGATARSMGYSRNIMNERECRIPHFHGTIDKMLAD